MEPLIKPGMIKRTNRKLIIFISSAVVAGITIACIDISNKRANAIQSHKQLEALISEKLDELQKLNHTHIPSTGLTAKD